MSPAANLALINLFVGDIQGGLGPFLATWLAEAADWNPDRVGLVTTIVGFATLALSGPFGAAVDQLGRPRLLLVVACVAILIGTLAILPARSFWTVLLAQFTASAGGTLLVPALTALTLGMVGKRGFPVQQGRNQAFNHVGIVVAALLVTWGTGRFGPAMAFWVLAAMAVGAIVAVIITPAGAWNGRRAMGWKEDEPNEVKHRDTWRSVFANKRLATLALALALFNLANGNMLALLGQKLVAAGIDGTRWTAIYVIVAQVTMVPVALFAGSLADRRGRRLLLLLACGVLPLRALLSAFLDYPWWLVAAEVLDGVASGVIGVAVPVVVADMTWGSGRTQAVLGTVNGIQGIGGALSGWVGGLLAVHLGWTGAFGVLAIPAVAAFAIVWWLEETSGGADEPRGSPPPEEPAQEEPDPDGTDPEEELDPEEALAAPAPGKPVAERPKPAPA